MLNKKRFQKIKLFVGILMCALAVFATPCTSFVSYAAEVSDVETCTDVRQWYYKVEDGKLYKRLYNASTGLWETDWIYLCEWEGDLQ